MMKTKAPEYLHLGAVLDRGWSRTLVERYLGEPDETRAGRNNTISLYSLARIKRAEKRKTFQRDLEKLAKRRAGKPAQPCDLLAAIFAVNRAAKRRRDAAQSHYECGQHGLAGDARRKKERLYALKDRGIAAAHAAGRLVASELHGGLCLWTGEGYSFHSRLVPAGHSLPRRETDQPLRIEAKPQGSREPKQRDAIAMLEALPEVPAGLERLESPSFRDRPREEEEDVNAIDDFDDNDFGSNDFDDDDNYLRRRRFRR